MSIQFIQQLNDELNEDNKYYALASIEDIELDTQNPRFASSTVLDDSTELNEQKIIKYLAQYGKLVDIMNSIIKNNGLYWEEWLSCYITQNKKLVVLEGNRRISACKALLDLNLLPEDFRLALNLPNDMTALKTKISRVGVVVYKDQEDAQNYITAKHTKPEIKKWETFEQCNYYHSQFVKGVPIERIVAHANESRANIIKDIKRFNLFINVFNATKQKHPDLLIEGKAILPLVDKLMPTLISKDVPYGLGLTYNETLYTYSPAPEKADIYNTILCMLGEAFFVRPPLNNNDLEKRDTSNEYRISTDEIKSKKKVNFLIENNIRIPGLKDLIAAYTELPKDKTNNNNSTQESANSESTEEKSPASDSEKQTASTKAEGTGTNNHSSSAAQNNPHKEYEFFEDLDYSTLNPQSIDDLGLYRICREIVKISNYNSNAGYKNFPIASTFLLRSLIEQTLTRQLKKTGYYDKVDNNPTKTPELGKMIEYILKQCNNGNPSPLNNDAKLVNLFNQTFAGFGTKGQLDTVIHQPHMIKPEQNFLNALSKQGIKSIIQTIITNLYVSNEAD